MVLSAVYISRATLEFERHWPPLDLEAGSIVWCMKRLRNYLWGTQFRICTDHKSLEHFAIVSDKNARVKRWLNTIRGSGVGYSPHIQSPVPYLPGNVRPDDNAALAKNRKAKSSHRRALSSQQESLGPSHPMVASTLYKLGGCAAAAGKTQEAEEFYRRAGRVRLRRREGGRCPEVV